MAVATKTRQRSAKRPSKAALIDAVMGRYAHVKTSSAKFAARKQREVEREGRRR
jgi:hypothetical protein